MSKTIDRGQRLQSYFILKRDVHQQKELKIQFGGSILFASDSIDSPGEPASLTAVNLFHIANNRLAV